ncbi:MAG: IS66 family transposase [Chloroflexi bacterium]|nr:IS66 family transposase [Chloroflexota bacterium]
MRTASRETLLRIIARQQQEILALQQTVAAQQAENPRLQAVVAEQQLTIERLEARLRDLEDDQSPDDRGRRGMPGLKPTQAPGERPVRPRKPRAQGAGRRRAAPNAVTDVIQHALEQCPDCGTALEGGTIKRTRQVVEVLPSPVQIVEHVFVERTCPGCHRRWRPRADASTLGGVVAGPRQRLGVGLVSLIATLREAGRWPVARIQWYLRQVHQLDLSVGAIVGACHQVAASGQTELATLPARIRGSPVVHADETGWRQNGRNGYVWTFSTPDTVLFTHGRRTKEMVDQVLQPPGMAAAEAFSGVLVSDFYAAYHHYPGRKQRCWAHLLRETHELRQQHPGDEQLATWAVAVHQLYLEAIQQVRAWEAEAGPRPAPRERHQQARADEERLLALCLPVLPERRAPQRKLCARIKRHLSELFVFVAEPGVPADNNAAERSLRHLVTSRKISGGTRSDQGTATKMALSSLFATWARQGLDPLLQCRRLLTSPQF